MYSSAPGKCPVVFSLFSGTLHAPIPLPWQLYKSRYVFCCCITRNHAGPGWWLVEDSCLTLEEIWNNCQECPCSDWSEWKRLLYAKFQPPRNLDQLADNMKKSWRMLGRNTDLLTSFCNSVQRRVRALYEAQGGATKYWVLPTTTTLKIFCFHVSYFSNMLNFRYVRTLISRSVNLSFCQFRLVLRFPS